MTKKSKLFSKGLEKLVKLDRIKDQKEIAADINRSPSTLNGWVLGRTKTPQDMWEPIARSLEITVEQIIEAGNLTQEPLPERDDEILKRNLELLEENNALLRDKVAYLESRIADLERQLLGANKGPSSLLNGNL